MLKTFLLLFVAAMMAAGFTGLICQLLWRFFWHGFVWALFVIVVFTIATVLAYWFDDQLAARKARAS